MNWLFKIIYNKIKLVFLILLYVKIINFKCMYFITLNYVIQKYLFLLCYKN